MKKVKNILQQKENQLYTVNSNVTVYSALKEMMDHNISAILIVDDNDLKGIFTERDYARKVVLQGKSSKETNITEVMSQELVTVNPDDTIDYCMQLITDRRIRHLPVVDSGELRGIVSIGDTVKSIIEDQKQTIKDLESYITS